MISEKEVKNIAKLAKIGLSKEEIKKFQKELFEILDYFNILKEADVSEVLPGFYLSDNFLKDGSGSFLNRTRKDEHSSYFLKDRSKLIDLSPDKKNNFIKVKEIFKNESL